MQQLNIDINKYLPEKQINLFETNEDSKNEIGIYVLAIKKIYEITKEKLEKEGSLKLFNEIEIPLITVLGEIQYNGMYCDKEELSKFGLELNKRNLYFSRRRI